MTRMKDLAPIIKSLSRRPAWSVAVQLRRRVGELLPERIKIPVAKALSIPENAFLAVLERMVRVNPDPILILGNQRSGTSAIAALLAELTGMSVTVDLVKNSRRPMHHKVYQGRLPFSEFVKANRLAFARDIIKECSIAVLGGLAVIEPFGLEGVAAVSAVAVIVQQVLMLAFARWRCGVWTHASPFLVPGAIRMVLRR